ncbi:hypothetical protein [Saccharopolyspora pogona]|nr:hypothetical protein [Saccharopolyspora pogona]
MSSQLVVPVVVARSEGLLDDEVLAKPSTPLLDDASNLVKA